MLLFLSSSFLARLDLIWKPELTAFLVGHRNFYFFAPDTIVQAPEIGMESIDRFLENQSFDQQFQLLGFLAPFDLPVFPGYIQVNTHASRLPAQWEAMVYRATGETFEKTGIRIKLPETT